MITPIFFLSQNNECLIIKVRLPYVKISSVDILADGNIFRLFLHPYFLEINLKNELKQNAIKKTVYDHNNFYLTIEIEKKNKDENFENLNLLTSLLNPEKKEKKILKKPLIEVISETKIKDDEKEEEKIINEFDLKEEFKKISLAPHYLYGFNNLYQDIFKERKEELYSLSDLDPEKTKLKDRFILKEKLENKKFLKEPFENDYEEVEHIISPEFTIYDNLNKKHKVKKIIIEKKKFALKNLITDKIYEKFINLKNKNYKLDEISKLKAFYTMTDILLAFLFDWRMTEFEINCESHWNINKISGSLSCFIEFENFNDVFKSFFRRSLIFPLYRSFDLSLRIVQDLKMIFFLGRSFILKFFLELERIFNKNNPKYLLNVLFINDICVFVQQLDEEFLRNQLLIINKLKFDYESLALPKIDEEKELEVKEKPKNAKRLLIEEIN